MDNPGHYDEYPELTRADEELERARKAKADDMTQNTKDAVPTEEEITAACTAYTRASGVLRDVIRDVLIAARQALRAPTAEQAEAAIDAGGARELPFEQLRALWQNGDENRVLLEGSMAHAFAMRIFEAQKATPLPREAATVPLTDEQILEIASEYQTVVPGNCLYILEFARALLSASKPAAPAQSPSLIGWWDSAEASGFRWKEGIVRSDFSNGTPIYANAAAPAQSGDLVDDSEIASRLTAAGIKTQYLTQAVTRCELWLTDGSIDVRKFAHAVLSAPQSSQSVEAGEATEEQIRDAIHLARQQWQHQPTYTVDDIVRRVLNSETAVPLDERAAHLELLDEVLSAKSVMLDAGCKQATFGEMFAEYARAASPQPQAQTERALTVAQKAAITYAMNSIKAVPGWNDGIVATLKDMLTAAQPASDRSEQ